MADLNDQQVDAFMRRLKLLMLAAGGVIGCLLLGGLLYMDARLESVRDTLRFRAPETSGDPLEVGHAASGLLNPVAGQTLYVPAYSHVFHGNGQSLLLTVTLSLRNTDPDHAIVATAVRYYDTAGKLVKSHLDAPLRLAPLATAEFLVERDDTSGGSGANFLVEWVAEQPVSEPLAEAVMIDTRGQQGISFVCRGTVVREVEPPADAAGETPGAE